MDPYLGEVRMVGFNFAPKDWALCNGQLLPISQNEALFTLIGAAYGGDGINTFALPDLRGRTPISFGTGSGLTPRKIGDALGAEVVALDTATMPGHQHAVACFAGDGKTASPEGAYWAAASNGGKQYDTTGAGSASMASEAIQAVGGYEGAAVPHENMMPFLGVTFVISLTGEFPPRPQP